MIKKQLTKYISDAMNEQSEDEKNIRIDLFREEKDYAVKHQLLSDDNFDKITLVENDASTRFSDAIIERCDKETEDVIARETASFLSQPLEHLKKNKNEFIYLESKWFNIIRVDAISLELDDVFETYTIMLGLKMQKKYGDFLKSYLDNHLHSDQMKYSIIFSSEDGLWDVNFALDYIDGFNEKWSLDETYQFIYRFLFKLWEAAEDEM